MSKNHSQAVKRLGTGVVLEKTSLGDSDTLERAIREMLSDAVYVRTIFELFE